MGHRVGRGIRNLMLHTLRPAYGGRGLGHEEHEQQQNGYRAARWCGNGHDRFSIRRIGSACLISSPATKDGWPFPLHACPRQILQGALWEGRKPEAAPHDIFVVPENETAGPSATLPRISCRGCWRWRTLCAFLHGKAHTLLCPVSRGRKSGYAPVGMTRLSVARGLGVWSVAS